MTDHTSATIFGDIFRLLARNPSCEHKEIAREIYLMAYEYDFSDYDMYAEEAGLALGIARKGEEGVRWGI